MSEAIGIYKKIHDIMKKVEFVTKDGKLGFGQNTFTIVTHDKVVSVVRQHFLDNNVIVVPHQVEKGISIEGTTKSGGKKIRFEAVYDVDFIDVEDGSKITIRSEAHAEDSGDKAANKALTYAVKNALLKVLMLQTGDDMSMEGINLVNSKQVKILDDLIVTSKANKDEFLAYYSIGKSDDMPQVHFAQAVDKLQQKIRIAKGK